MLGLEKKENVSPQSETNWELLPNEIWLKIIRTVLHQSDFNYLENHVCFVLDNLKLVNHRFFSLASNSIEDLPRIYVKNPALLPKPKRQKYVASIMSLIREFGSFSGLVLGIKPMLNFSGWNSVMLVLLPCTHSSFIILVFCWKKEKMIFMENFWLKQFVLCWYWFLETGLTSFCSFVYKKNQRWSWKIKKKSQNSEFMWSKPLKYYKNSLW